VQEGFDDVALFGELDDVFAFEGQHDDQFCDDVCQLGDAGLVETQEVIEDVDVDEDGVGCVLSLHSLGVAAADGVEFAEEGGCCFSVGIEEYVLEEGAHEMEVVKAEAGGVCLLRQEEDDLSEVVSDEALVGVAAQTAEGEADEFLQEQEVLLFVVVEFVERVQLVGGAFQPQDEVVGKQLNDVLVEGLGGVVVGAVGFDEYELQTVICAVFGVVDEVAEELVHVGFEDVAEVDWVVDLGEDEHEVLEVSLLVALVVGVQVVVVQQFEDAQAVA
jgi:hypothetical protein